MIYGEFMGQMDTVAQTYGLRNKEMALLTCILNSFIDYLWCLLILLSFTVLWILHLTGVHEIGNFTKSYFRFTIHVFCISIVSLIIASFIIWAKPYNTPALNVAHWMSKLMMFAFAGSSGVFLLFRGQDNEDLYISHISFFIFPYSIVIIALSYVYHKWLKKCWRRDKNLRGTNEFIKMIHRSRSKESSGELLSNNKIQGE